ncbi:MAG: hypothetical protein Q7U76_01220 [Nitrospirota bacterium]|nr:hypothetical protein [Nitrospirota bacterium]
MLKKTASGVLASRRGSQRTTRVRLASSLAAVLLDGLFEHPEVIGISLPYGAFSQHFYLSPSFFAAC